MGALLRQPSGQRAAAGQPAGDGFFPHFSCNF
jgi:hypothetical protein